MDQQDVDHLLFDEDFSGAREELDTHATLAGRKEMISDLLYDGTSHTFYFFFWVDSGNTVISLVELWEGVGQGGTGYNQDCLQISIKGYVSLSVLATKVGIGTVSSRIYPEGLAGYYIASASGGLAEMQLPGALLNNHVIAVRFTVTNDLLYLFHMGITLSNE